MSIVKLKNVLNFFIIFIYIKYIIIKNIWKDKSKNYTMNHNI